MEFPSTFEKSILWGISLLEDFVKIHQNQNPPNQKLKIANRTCEVRKGSKYKRREEKGVDWAGPIGMKSVEWWGHID